MSPTDRRSSVNSLRRLQTAVVRRSKGVPASQKAICTRELGKTEIIIETAGIMGNILVGGDGNRCKSTAPPIV